MKYSLKERAPSEPREILRPMLEPLPVSERDVQKASIFIKNNCGRDNVCVPNLRTLVEVDVPEYVLGSRENVLVTVHIDNRGEDAFQTKTLVRVPRGVSFSKFEVVSKSDPDLNPICSSVVKEEVEKVVCDIGNPLPSGAKVTLLLVFQPKPEAINDSALEFHVTTSSANEEREDDTHDNHVALALPVTVRSDIDIKGISWPDGPFDYNVSRFGSRLVGENGRIAHEKEIGPEVMHIYHVTNQGPSDLPGAHIYLLWPTRTLSGDPLLYLLDATIDSAPAVCHTIPDINYLGLKVEDSSYEHLVASPLNVEEGEASLSATANGNIAENTIKDEDHRRKRRHSHPNHHHNHHRRTRNTEEVTTLEDELSCGPTNCTRVVCSIFPFRDSDNVVVRVRSRLWVDTIEKIGMSEVKISSRLVVVGTNGRENGSGVAQGQPLLPDHTQLLQNQVGMVWSGTVTTIVRTGTEEHQTSLKWVVICGSILAGLLLLALLCLILWAMGFFKRKRPQDKNESEPLNGNGFYGNENGKS